MPLPKDEAWFLAKTYGWGWSFPRRWQGWLVTLLFFTALFVGTPLVKMWPIIFLGYILGLTAVLVAICYWKGEKPHWSWKKRE